MAEGSSRGPEWERIRRAVLERDGWLCSACSKPLEGDDATVDHIIPKAKGGTDDMVNLISLCRSDNSKKGDRELLRVTWINTAWLPVGA